MVLDLHMGATARINQKERKRMNAPDRSAQVREIVARHPETFQGPLEERDSQKKRLLFRICRELNIQDPIFKGWGVLQKLDQGGKIPADILVWQQTREHFDILSDTGALWIPMGVLINPAWVWFSAEVPEPPPPPPPPPVVEDENIRLLLDAVTRLAESQEILIRMVRMLGEHPHPPAPSYVGKVKLPFVGEQTIRLRPE